MIMDELKLSTDDTFYTEDHVIFLLDKYRAFVLKQRYADIKKPMPESNYQTICLDLIEVPAIPELLCEGTMLRSKEKVPILMPIGVNRLYSYNYYIGDLFLTSRDRMKYVGENKYTRNNIYASIAPDNYLWLKSKNPQYLYLEKVRLTGVFEDTKRASELSCGNKDCDILEQDFPLEASLVSVVSEMILKELHTAKMVLSDDTNDAKDIDGINAAPVTNQNTNVNN